MRRAGEAVLPLHRGSVPQRLIRRMVRLADQIAYLIVVEEGPRGLLRKLSDPFWFQSLGCVLGFDWHSSGLTTVTTGVLKMALRIDRHGVAVAGGKGKKSLLTPEEIREIGGRLGFSGSRIEELIYASRMAAKVDNALVQDGYQLYHHAFFLTEKGEWAVVQQGMNPDDRTARRYHWISGGLESFVVEPHSGVVGERRLKNVLNMTAREAEGNRKASVDLVREGPIKLKSLLRSVRPGPLDRWLGYRTEKVPVLRMPWSINWEAVKKAYEIQPGNYEELVSIRGVGPATIRALSLVAELIYGEPASWRDPVKYTFAHGGKDGVPYPVDFHTYDETIRTLEEYVKAAEVSEREKLSALRRLAKLKLR